MALNKIKINDTTTVNTGVVYDITKVSGQSYDTLSAALGTDGNNIPSEVREGGMTIRFVQTSDNKYVQYRLMSTSFSTNEADWQGVDDEPTAISENLVKSGGIAEIYGSYQENDFYVDMIVDKNDNIIEGTKKTGCKYFPNGIKASRINSICQNRKEL